MTTQSFSVSGMTCGNCERHVREAVGKLLGVASIDVNYQESRATVQFDPRQTTAAAIVAAITEAGYDAREADR